MPAVTSGSSIAVNEPNAMNSTIAAAMKPNTRLELWLVGLPAWAMLPSTWNSTPPPEPDWITLTKCWAWPWP